LDRLLHLAQHKDIDHVVYTEFPENFVVKVEDKQAMDEFLSEKFKVLVEISGLNHIESNGEAILIFSNDSIEGLREDDRVCRQLEEDHRGIDKGIVI